MSKVVMEWVVPVWEPAPGCELDNDHSLERGQMQKALEFISSMLRLPFKLIYYSFFQEGNFQDSEKFLP